MAKRDEFAEKTIKANIGGTIEGLQDVFYFNDLYSCPSVMVAFEEDGTTLFAEIFLDEEGDAIENLKEAVEDVSGLPHMVDSGRMSNETIVTALREQMGMRYISEGGAPSMFSYLPSMEASEALLEIARSWKGAMKLLDEHGATRVYESVADTDRRDFLQIVKDTISTQPSNANLRGN